MDEHRLALLERQLTALEREQHRARRRRPLGWLLAFALGAGLGLPGLLGPARAGGTGATSLQALKRRVTALEEALEKETKARKRADREEAQAREDTDARLDELLEEEADARAAGDAGIRASLTEESTARIGAVDAIHKTIDPLFKYLSISSKDVIFSGCNVHIRNGLGATNGNPDDPGTTDPAMTGVNGLGNLFIGYNEALGERGRSGSHNLVVGAAHSYTAFGSLLAGFGNVAQGAYASVTGGFGNAAVGDFSSISSGFANSALGLRSGICGGLNNSASGVDSVVVGGKQNAAAGEASAVHGGVDNTATGVWSAVSGGEEVSVSTDRGWAAGAYHTP
jgi:hypothetical protein